MTIEEAWKRYFSGNKLGFVPNDLKECLKMTFYAGVGFGAKEVRETSDTKAGELLREARDYIESMR